MISTTVSNTIMNSSRIHDFNNSQSDMDSSFIQTPDTQDSPRRPLSIINDINTHHRNGGIHSGPIRVPMKEKTPAKASRTPNSKKTNKGYLGTTEAYRNGFGVNSPARIPFKSPGSIGSSNTTPANTPHMAARGTPSRTRSPTRSASTPPSTKRTARSSSASTSRTAASTPTTATKRTSSSKPSVTAPVAVISSTGKSMSTPVKPSSHHSVPAVTMDTQTPTSSTPVRDTPTSRSGSRGHRRSTSSGNGLGASPSPARTHSANAISSPSGDVFARLTIGLPTRHTAPAVPITKKHSRKPGSNSSTPSSTTESGKKKSKIPVGAAGSSSGTPPTGTSGVVVSPTVSSQTKATRAISADRLTRRESKETSTRNTITSITAATATPTSTGYSSGPSRVSSAPSRAERVSSKSLLRVSNASSTSLPPALTATETTQVLQNIQRHTSASASASNAVSKASRHETRSGVDMTTEAVVPNTTVSATALIRDYPRPPPSLDFTISDTSFTLSNYQSMSMVSTAMGHTGRNMSSEWGSNMSALSPIGRIDNDAQYSSASYTTVDHDRSVPADVKVPVRNIDPNTTNDSDLTVTTVGSLTRPVPLSGPQLYSMQQQRLGLRTNPVATTTTSSCHNGPANSSSDPFPDEMSCVEQDESRSSSPRSLMSGTSACWTQASELNRFPTADSHSFDEAFYQEMIHRGTTRTPLQPDFMRDSGLHGGRKTYLDDALQKEVRSSSGGSLGTSMFSKLKEEEANTEHMLSSTRNDEIPTLQRAESVVYGATDEDNLSINTGCTDVLNTALIRGSSFVSMLSTSSASSLSLMSPLTLGSTWSNFSPRGEVKSRFPSNIASQPRLGRAVSDGKPTQQIKQTSPQRAISDSVCIVEDAMHAQLERSEEYSFSLTRQNSSNEIVENHDSSVELDDSCDAPVEDDCCNVDDDCQDSNYVDSDDEEENDDDFHKAMALPSPAALKASLGLHIDTTDSAVRDLNTSNEEGQSVHFAPLSLNDTEISGASVAWSATPLSSTMSVLNRAFVFDAAGSADEADNSLFEKYQVDDNIMPTETPPIAPRSTASALADLKARLQRHTGTHRRVHSEVSTDSLREGSLTSEPHEEELAYLSQKESERVANLQQAPVASQLLSGPDQEASLFDSSMEGDVYEAHSLPSPNVNFISDCLE